MYCLVEWLPSIDVFEAGVVAAAEAAVLPKWMAVAATATVVSAYLTERALAAMIELGDDYQAAAAIGIDSVDFVAVEIVATDVLPDPNVVVVVVVVGAAAVADATAATD
jgi:hypothetical protein